jgi:hypothetical protein
MGVDNFMPGQKERHKRDVNKTERKEILHTGCCTHVGVQSSERTGVVLSVSALICKVPGSNLNGDNGYYDLYLVVFNASK